MTRRRIEPNAVAFIRALAAILLLSAVAEASAAAPPRFELTLDEKVVATPYTGRVFLALSQAEGAPLERVGWFLKEPLLGLDVTDWKPDDKLVFDVAKARGFPQALTDLPAGKWRAQASIELNRDAADVIRGAGNVYSAPVEFVHDPTASAPVRLKLAQKRPTPVLKDTERLRYVSLRSALLSKFHGRDILMKAAVLLPESYASETDKRYPAIYVISGFGETLQGAQGMLSWLGPTVAGGDFRPALVYLDAECSTGHHVWADSANNGPWGTALVEELIPHLEKMYRLIADVDARYITGVSSGGWASLWVQVTHPEVFGGVWSCSPDPVDFTAFQTIDIYDASANFWTMPDGSPRPISRPGMMGQLLVKPFAQLEETLGRGGQLQSFDAVFGPRGANGRVVPLWDRETGKIDANVAEYWKKYDIRLIVERDWKTLAPKLAGKLYLYCGDADTFCLEAAFNKLAEALKKLGSDAYIELMPGVPHTVTPMQMSRMATQMQRQFETQYLNRQSEPRP